MRAATSRIALRRTTAATMSALRVRACAVTRAARGLATSADEKARLIAQYPYAWPWGQTIDVKTPRYNLKIKIPQDQPGPKQHKLAYKIDTAPPEVPHSATYFVGPVGKSTHALLNAAVAAGNLDGYKQALDALAVAYETKREVKFALLNPRTSAEDKLEFVRELAASVGADAALTEQLVALQNEKKLHKINEIARNFGVLVAENRKEKHGAIISAEPLSEKHYDAITAKMQKLVKADEKLLVTREIEPNLVGGFIVRIGNRAQDLSVQSQIARMEQHLKDFFSKNKEAVDKVLAA